MLFDPWLTIASLLAPLLQILSHVPKKVKEGLQQLQQLCTAGKEVEEVVQAIRTASDDAQIFVRDLDKKIEK